MLICLLASAVMVNAGGIKPLKLPRAKMSAELSRTSSASFSSQLSSKITSSLQQKPHPLTPKVPTNFSHIEVLPYQFQARATGADLTNCFSGTFVKTQYNGKPFLTAVMAAHPFEKSNDARDGTPLTLRRDFTVDVYIDGKFISAPAHAEVAAAPSMADIVLVTLPSQILEKVKFASLDRKPFKQGDRLVSFGFSDAMPRFVENRIVTSQTPFCLRTTMPIARDDRPGMCGSFVGREETPEIENTTAGETSSPTDVEPQEPTFVLSGVHTGSSPAKGNNQDMGNYSKNEQHDIGHITKASMIDLLVRSYFNDGNATFPLQFGEHTIFDMRLDEYISYIKLFDENGKLIWQRHFSYKFAYDQVNSMIEQLSPRSLEMSIHRVQWTDEQLLELRKRWDRTRYTIRYDFESKTFTKSVPKFR